MDDTGIRDELNPLIKTQTISIDDSILLTTNKFKNVDIISSKLMAELGINEEQINENIIYFKALLLKKFIEENELKNQNIFIYSDEDDFSYAFKEIFVNVLSDIAEISLFELNRTGEYSKKFVEEIIFNNKFSFSISIVKNKISQFYEIRFYEDGINKISQNLQKFLNTKDLQTFLKIEQNKHLEKITETINLIKVEDIKLNKDYLPTFAKKTSFYTDSKDEYKELLSYSPNVSFNDFKVSKKEKKVIKLERTLRTIVYKENKHKSDLFVFIDEYRREKIIFARDKKQKYLEILNNEQNAIALSYIKEIKAQLLKDTQRTKIHVFFKNHKTNYLRELLKKDGDFIVQSAEFDDVNQWIAENKDEIRDGDVLVYANKIHLLSKKDDKIEGHSDIYSTLLSLKAIEYFDSQNKNVFDVINEFYENHQRESHTFEEFKVSFSSFTNFIKEIKEKKEIAGHKIKRTNINREVLNTNKRRTEFSLVLENGQTIIVLYNKLQNQLKIQVFSVFSEKNELVKIVKKEEEIFNYFKTFATKNNYSNDKNKLLNILKFSSFLLIIIGIFVFLFFTIYKVDGEKGTEKDIFQIFYKIFLEDYKKRFITLIFIFSMFFYYLLGSLMFKRMFAKQNEHIKYRHALISSFITTIIQSITPFSFGGDLGVFWYLQKKGYYKPKIASALAVSGTYHQIAVLLISLIFIPIGIFEFYDVLFTDLNTEKIFTLIFIVLGILLNVVLFLIILFISTFKTLQRWIINLVIIIKRNDPRYHYLNLERQRYLLINKFKEFKAGFTKLFKDWKFFLECMIFYKIFPFLVAFSVPMIILINPSIISNKSTWEIIQWYFSFQSAQALLNMANNLSPAPGGVGSSDWLTTVIFKGIFSTNDQLVVTNSLKILTFSQKVLFWIIPNIFSSAVLLTVYLGEKRLDKYRNIQSIIKIDSKLASKYTRTKTTFFKNAALVWFVVSSGLIAFLLFH
ncbi:lysylphosphatidylglycerol synthase transmembrane domain-containing protein [Mycoplasma procyoni]|uniref:lysylphosphatidylglycerol synthase transmembrane domain-containing protein n=1 Tax=Mycoplasma procyoni TaxID=568784 RepID=UPI00197CB1B4|nr:lysylphosphatidylglycerol synthase transmembrane domain-containing protein [Mycoplasma procyoni]MBN3534416.1 flippase-like domain-containing protein [Mycoplasma procyoni]